MSTDEKRLRELAKECEQLAQKLQDQREFHFEGPETGLYARSLVRTLVNPPNWERKG